MLPVIALVGRPNVGKSTLYNRLTKTRDAIVADFAGLTRDRHYGDGKVGPRPYIVVDTGGFEPQRPEGVVSHMASQAELAIEEADAVIFIVDARTGVTPQDHRIAQTLRESGRKIYLAVNKAEGLSAIAGSEFYELGLGVEPFMVSAAHGQGIASLMETVLSPFPEDEEEEKPAEEEEGEHRIRVAIAGRPNVGKSTLLSVVSKARPKIANYHFTTLYPNLGVVYVDEGVSFVMADIPGIIEGAAEGAGLGHDFLRHIDRCRLLVHVVDVSGSEGRDPVEDFDAINAELSQYSPDLATRPQIVVANKTDIMEDESLLEKLRAHVEPLGYPLFALSAASHTGTRELVLKIAEKLSTLPPVTVYEPEYVPKPVKIDASEPLKITVEDNTYIVEGKWLERLMSNINFGDYESRMFFDKMLRENGVFQQLEDLGIKDGDIVSMYELEFEYQH